MSTAQPLSSGLRLADRPRVQVAPRAPSAESPWLSTAVVVAGLAVAIAGGVGKRGALDLLPGLDGTLVTGVVAMLLMVLQGYRSRFGLLVAAPLVAVSAIGFFRVHERPLAPLGMQIAVIGAIAVVTDLVRARRGAR